MDILIESVLLKVLRHRRVRFSEISNCRGWKVLLLGAFAAAIFSTSGAGAEPVSQTFRNRHGGFFHLLQREKAEVSLNYRYEPLGDEKNGPGEFSLHYTELDAEFPVPLTADTFIRAGFRYQSRIYDFENVPASPLESGKESLHGAAVVGGLGRFITNDLLVTGIAWFGPYSDFSGGLGTEDFQLQAEGMLVYRINPGAQLLLGAAATQTFDDSPVVPVFGLRLASSDGRLHINLTAPFTFRLGYHYTSRLEFYGGAWLSGDTYRVENNSREFDIHVHDRRLGGGARYLLGKYLSLGLEAGAMWGSKLDFKSREAAQFDGDLDPAPYVSARIGFSL